MSLARTALIRAAICARCPSPCARQHDATWHATACAACPLTPAAYPQAWGTYGACAEVAAAPAVGLGDQIAAAAAPVASWIDSKLGTRVANCGGCKSTHRQLNGGDRSLPGERPPTVI